MKRETKLLLSKAKDSLVLAIELFNRPHDVGRATASLIFLNHSFEMLMKAAILHKNGRIYDDRIDKNTISFKECLRRGYSNNEIKFLTEEQVISLQAINGERDAAQHYILQISEQQLYIFMQSGVTMFGDILHNVFGEHLKKSLPYRVLPIATAAPLDMETLFRYEIMEIKKLLLPKSRKKMEAIARIRPLAILNSAIQGENNSRFSKKELNMFVKDIQSGKSWNEIFPGIASVELTQQGQGASISLRISKKAETKFQLVQEGEGAEDYPMALKRVNELDYYNLSFTALRNKLQNIYPSINQANLQVFIKYFKIKENPDYYKEFKRGKTVIKGYSQDAFVFLSNKLKPLDIKQKYLEWRNK